MVNVSSDYEHIYLDSDHNKNQESNSFMNEDYHLKMKDIYDDYICISTYKSINKNSSKNIFLKFRNTVGNINNRRRWDKELVRQVEIIKPDAIMYLSESQLSYQVLAFNFPDIPMFLLQPVAIRKAPLHPPKKTSKKDIAINWLLNKIFFPYSAANEKKRSNSFFLVWSKLWISERMKRKYSGIRVVGSILFDTSLKNQLPKNEKKRLRESLGVPENKSLILIALNKKRNIGKQGFMEFIEIYKKVISMNPTVFFILKVHPSEDEYFINSLFKSSGVSNFMIIKKIAVNHLISIANIFVTHWSATIYEALAASIPIILVNPKNRYDFSLMYLDNYGSIAPDSKVLSEYIQKASNPLYEHEFESIRNQFIEEQIFRADGKSA